MKRISIIIMLALSVAMTITAQQGRRTTTPRKPAAAATTKTTSTSANICTVRLNDISLEKPLAEDANYLYLIDQLDRSVITIDKKTGDIKKAIPGGRDQMITAIGHDGKDLYMMVTNIGLVRYDGQSRETSQCLYPTSDYGKGVIGHQRAFTAITFSPNGRWLVAYGNGVLLFDMDNGQCKFVREYSNNGIQNVFAFDDGSMIALTTDEIVAIPATAAASIKSYHETDGGAKYYKVKNDIRASTIKDGVLYACWNRFMAKTPLPWQDIKWELIYQLESEDNRFRNFAIGPKSIFAECEEFGQYYCQWSSNDFSGTPQVTDAVSTTIIDKLTNKPRVLKRNSDMLHYDQQGNLIMYNYENLDIYNPNGIKGYTNLQNKVTRFPKP